MTIYPLPPHARAEGFSTGILLLDFREPHALGDTANAATYPFPTQFLTVKGASVERITAGDPSMAEPLIAAAQELERRGARSISSNCGLMVHYQDAVARAVNIPVFLSSLLQIPMACRSIGANRTVGIIGSFVSRIGQDVLALAGAPEHAKTAVTSIEDSPEFLNLSTHPLDTQAFTHRLVAAAQDMSKAHPDLGAVVIECATFTPYAEPIQREIGVPVYDFVSLIEFAHGATHRRSYVGT